VTNFVSCAGFVLVQVSSVLTSKTNDLPRGSRVNKLMDATRRSAEEESKRQGPLYSDWQFPFVNDELEPGVVLPTVDGPIPLAERWKICVADEVSLDVREIHRIGPLNGLCLD
jgi:hypothetical protein